jgi:hypothetical protein
VIIFCLVVSVIFEPKPFGGVMSKSRYSRKLSLDPTDRATLRDVCISNPAISPGRICGYSRFRGLRMRHELFNGRGWELLQHLGVRDKNDYIIFMAKLFPGAASRRFLETAGKMRLGRPNKLRSVNCGTDAAHLLEQAARIESFGDRARRSLGLGSRALFGLEFPSPELFMIGRESLRGLLLALGSLRPREEDVLRKMFGIGREKLSATKIAADFGITKRRVYQILKNALWKMRHPSRSAYFVAA